jgi:hypothetical protein
LPVLETSERNGSFGDAELTRENPDQFGRRDVPFFDPEKQVLAVPGGRVGGDFFHLKILRDNLELPAHRREIGANAGCFRQLVRR